jgi:hypothetical protein
MQRITNSILIFSFLFIFVNYQNSFETYKPKNVQNNVVIDRDILADMLGNNNKIASKEELAKLDNFFSINDVGWVVGEGYIRFGNSIPADTIKKYFQLYSPLYKDKAELRDAYSTISTIVTPVVGIFAFKSNNEIIIERLYRVTGYVDSDIWQEIKIL